MRRKHRDLDVWNHAVGLVEIVYRTSAGFPSSERYGLTGQLRRAAVSVPSNIAEGYARPGTKELLYFLGIAAGSLSELDTLIELAQRLGFLNDTQELREKLDDVSGMLMGLQASPRRRLRA